MRVMILKARLKIDRHWLDKERMSMAKLMQDYKEWELTTLKKAKEAKDMESLRKLFYELGDRWEWDQATGAWLSKSEPLDTICLVLRMPGLDIGKERYVIYAIMAYSKGVTATFDHLGDKERVILERDVETGKFIAWSTTGHGMVELKPLKLYDFKSIEEIIKKCFLIAQPGDHALRIEVPPGFRGSDDFHETLWTIVNGLKEFEVKKVDVLNAPDVESRLDFQFYRYANAVISLERKWRQLSGTLTAKAREIVLDKIPQDIEKINKQTLRRIEGLLHILWFWPPFHQQDIVRMVYKELSELPNPTSVQKELIPYLGELLYSLNNIIEKAQYIKWRSVMDKKRFSSSDIFEGLELDDVAKAAFAVALDDMLREHTLAYIGYPERATWKNKIFRTVFGLLVLPVRLAYSFMISLRSFLLKLQGLRNVPTEAQNETDN